MDIILKLFNEVTCHSSVRPSEIQHRLSLNNIPTSTIEERFHRGDFKSAFKDNNSDFIINRN